VEGPRFLPPEAPGPEPDLSESERKQPPPPPPPPAAQQTYGGYQAPQAGYGYPPQGGWAHYQPQVPGNGQAVTGFVFSLVGLCLLVLSAGLSTIVSLGCAITGVVCSRNGKQKVDRGETPSHRGLAQAGFVIGWVGVGLSILATIGWVLVLVVGVDADNPGNPGEVRSAVALMVGG
jgi:hypothetical protein